MPTARLSELTAGLQLEQLVGGDAQITGICTDSRQVARGDLYFARMGWFVDANAFVVDALARGAAALVVTRAEAVPAGCPVPVWLSRAEDRDLALLADRFFGHPSRSLKVFAVTGTNGKTSTAFICTHMLKALGGKPMLVGTVRHEFDGKAVVARNTTPDGLFVHGFCAQNLALGATALVIEASSHGLELERIAGLAVDAAGFTNLTHDHLDFHKTFDAYRDAKARLFVQVAHASDAVGKRPVGVFVTDAPEGTQMLQRAAGCVARLSVSGAGRSADVSLEATRDPDRAGMLVRGVVVGVAVEGFVPLIGRHNLENVGVALGMVAAVYPDRVQEAFASLASFAGVPGRLELVRAPLPGEAPVLVDYAHSPDAIERVIDAVTEAIAAPVTVAGCGGDRDAAKRPAMGAAASQRAAFCVLTSDNPRSESPATILEQMRSGVAEGDAPRVVVEPDRSAAIALAVAQAGDRPVVVMGKGHEATQEVAGRRHHFVDAEEARRALMGRDRSEAVDGLWLLAGWSGERLASAVGGRLLAAGPRRGFAGLSTDTRSLGAGAVFVALRGAHHDAHAHLAAADAAGALVVEDAGAVPAGYRGAVVLVSDTLAALGRLANAVLTEARARVGHLEVIGVTGSNGKTSVKEMTAAIARARLGSAAVVATEGNLNNHIGLPLTVGRVAPRHRLAVLEMGANQPRDIYELAAIAEPEVAVITSIGRAHLEGFGGSLDDVRRAKIGIASIGPRLLVLPHTELDHPVIRRGVDARTTIVTFGRDGATIVVMRDPGSNMVSLRGNGPLAGWEARVGLRYEGTHNAFNLAAAVLANSARPDGSIEAPSPEVVAAACDALELPGGRLRERVMAGRVVIDDAYNANPDSVAASLTILAARSGLRIAVLGEMRELGPDSETLHRATGVTAAERSDVVLGVGAMGAWIAEGAGRSGVAVADPDAAIAWLAAHAPPGATILVKASRGARLERVVEGLTSLWKEA